ncbi:mesoderm-specific transcript homolog protein-like [Gigantopelta aegis]|uniref:mesoderm-specific transcript homolog protein-like n=1 Tax=Gigantopelta aegis TaxID=1735272 RepID=UPI001B88C05D|nr:mesoderm-specific transcript homolog protein-like [Gigantopelta aegis]
MTPFYVIAFLALVLSFFIYYPSPDLSERLLSWKRKGQTIRYNQMDVFFIDEPGTGSYGTVFCLHGFPTSSHDWIKVLDGLKEQFSRVVLLDFLGHGFSEKPTPYVYSIFEQATIVEVLAKKLGVSRAHLLSHDYGDTVALELLARYNKKRRNSELQLQTLCLLNGGLFPGKYHPRRIQKLLLIPVIGSIATRLTFFQLFKFSFAEIFGDNKPSHEEMQDFYAAVTYKSGHIAMPEILHYIQERAENENRWVGALKESAIPVLMIYGPADPVNPPPFQDYFRRIAPRHGIVVLEDRVGHYPQWEAPNTLTKHYNQFVSKQNTVTPDV